MRIHSAAELPTDAQAVGMWCRQSRLAGVVRDDVMAEDLITTASMACRPVPRLPDDVSLARAHRRVTVHLHGPRPEGARPLPAPAPGDFDRSPCGPRLLSRVRRARRRPARR